jgi:hypothetical protein
MHDTDPLKNHCNRMTTGQSSPEPMLLVRNSATVSRVIAGETLVVPICAGIGDMEAIYTFNGAGGELWHSLEQSQSEDDLIALIMQRFGIPADVAGTDVRAFLSDLKEVGLLEQVALPDPANLAADRPIL